MSCAVVAWIERARVILSVAAASVACLIMLAMAGLIFLQVILRFIFSESLDFVGEYVGYGFGAMVFLALSLCLDKGQLIRVEILSGRMPPSCRRVLEGVICSLAIAMMALMLQFSFMNLRDDILFSAVSTTTVRTPLWIPDILMIVGISMFTIRLILYEITLVLGGSVIENTNSIDE